MLVNKLKMYRRGSILYDESIIETTDLPIKEKARNYTHELYFNLQKLGYEIDFDNSSFCGQDTCTLIVFSEGKHILVSCEQDNTVSIFVKVKIEHANSFEFFDNIVPFERFYRVIIEMVKNINKQFDEEMKTD